MFHESENFCSIGSGLLSDIGKKNIDTPQPIRTFIDLLTIDYWMCISK